MDSQDKTATSPFPAVCLHQNENNPSIKTTRVDQEIGHSNASMIGMVFEQKCHNFTCFGQGDSKYEKLSSCSFLVKNVNNDLISHDLSRVNELGKRHDPSPRKNFSPFFLKKQSDRVRCIHNVETMTICTMVNSVKSSLENPPKILQRSQNYLFTKETFVNLSKGHQKLQEPGSSASYKEKTVSRSFSLSPDIGFSNPVGAKIQPLRGSSDYEENENASNPLISAQTDAVQIEVSKDQRLLSGVALSPLEKDDAVDENCPTESSDTRRYKAQSKRPISEKPEINKGFLPLQPAVSSTRKMKASTSRVCHLNNKHLFSCGEDTLRSEFNAKRQKLNSSGSIDAANQSSEVEDASSHDKFNIFFNKIMSSKKGRSIVPVSSKPLEKEQMLLVPNSESPVKSGNSSMGLKRNRSCRISSSWIERWQHHCTDPQKIISPEPLVTCELQNLKSGLDELTKKQSPSLAALALMGKAMNGVRPCEFKRRGPVIVWNTQEY